MSILTVLALKLVTFIGLVSAVDVTCNQNAVTNMLKKNSTAENSNRIQVVTFIKTMDNFTCDQVALLNFLQMKLHHSQLFDIEYSLIYLNKSHGLNAHNLEKLSEIADSKMTVLHSFSESETSAMGKFEEHHVIILDRCGRVTYQILPPWSFVQYPYVKAAILSTYFDDPCGNCTLKSRNATSEREFKDRDSENWNKSRAQERVEDVTTQMESSPIQVNIFSTKELILKMDERRNDTLLNGSSSTQNDTNLINAELTESTVTRTDVSANATELAGNETEVYEVTTEMYEEKSNKTERVDKHFFEHYVKFFPWIGYDLQ